MKTKVILLLAILMTTMVSIVPLTVLVQADGIPTGPYVDQLTFYATTDESKALGDLSAGLSDMYLWRIPSALLEKARADSNLKLVQSQGGYICILLNPAPVASSFNPFSVKAIRQAVNYLIDRDYIINVLHLGDAAPKILYFGRYDADYQYMADLAEALNSKYLYNFEKAKQLITAEMTKAGAVKDTNGIWTKGGKQVTLNPLIRSDDPVRKTVGDLLATDLEDIGFVVNRIYGDLNKAYDLVYGSDPIVGSWSFYTEGYRSSALGKYDINGMPQMYCPYYANMPGYQEPGWWQYTNATLDTWGNKYASGDFADLEERAELMRKTVTMGFEESVRLFLVDQLYTYAYNSRLPNIAYELAVGTQSPFSFFTLRDPTATGTGGTGGSMKIAQKQMYQGAYSPITSSSDVYSSNIMDLILDPGLWPDPHTGKYIPIRANYVVETAGPTGKLDVPATVETYDYINHQWTTVGSGVNATTKITYTYKLSNFHHGQPMTVADSRYALYMVLEWATKSGADDVRYDAAYAGVHATEVDTFVGVNFIGNDKVEVYTNYWFPDDSQIAGFYTSAPNFYLFPSMPWEALYTAERVVQAKNSGFSRAAANAIGKQQMDFIAPNTVALLKTSLSEIIAGNYVQDAFAGLPYFDTANRTARYTALNNWVTAHDHFLVGNGPFYLDKTDRLANQDILKAFRDPTYPYKAGDWNYLIPTNTPEISTEAPSTVVIGKAVVFNVKVNIGGFPSSAADVVYLILDSSANVILNGKATPSSVTGTFQVVLSPTDTAKFQAGGYSLKIIAYAQSIIVPRFDSKVFTALPPFEEIIGSDIATVRADLASVSSRVTGLQTTTTDIQTKVKSLEANISTLTTLLYVAMALVVIAIVAPIILRKK